MIKNKKRFMAALGVISIIIVSAVGGTYAYFTSQDSRSNIITMGRVNGTLTETGETIRDDGSSGKDYTNIKPGSTVDKDPTVTIAADSLDAYVRVHISYTKLSDAQITELESQLKLNSGWYRADDGVFYYNQPLSAGQFATVFNQVKIPTSWGNEMAEQTFHMDIVADLIQADQFSPETTVVDGVTYVSGWSGAQIK